MKQRYYRMVGFVLLLWLIMGTTVAAASLQDDFTPQLQITASEAVYIDPAAADNNWNEQLLFATYGLDTPGQRILLKFDLTTVTAPITQGGLVLAMMQSPGQPCLLITDFLAQVSVYATEDSWLETEVTWNSRPNQGNLLATTTDVNQETLAVRWLTGTAESDLLTYLEAERQGDGVISFWVEASDGLGQMIFEDNELTGSNFGCSGGNFAPTLQLITSGEVDGGSGSTPGMRPETRRLLIWVGAGLVIFAFVVMLINRQLPDDDNGS